MESADERDDGLWYHGLLFRDADRTVFGGFEIISPTITVPEFERQYDIRSIAAKIVRNKDFRESLIAEDGRIADLWKRH